MRCEGTYLTGVRCTVCHRRHHQRNNNTTGAPEKHREHNQPRRRGDGQPAEQQHGGAVTGQGGDVELASMLGKSAAQNTTGERAGVDDCEKVGREGRRHAVCLGVRSEVKVRRPEAEDHQEEAGDLEGVRGLLEGVEFDQAALPRHPRARTNHDRGDEEEEQADEAACALCPREPDARVVDEVGQDDRVDDAAYW